MWMGFKIEEGILKIIGMCLYIWHYNSLSKKFSELKKFPSYNKSYYTYYSYVTSFIFFTHSIFRCWFSKVGIFFWLPTNIYTLLRYSYGNLLFCSRKWEKERTRKTLVYLVFPLLQLLLLIVVVIIIIIISFYFHQHFLKIVHFLIPT